MIHREFELDLYLIRHGESANNRRSRSDPWDRNPPLTERGVRQARAVGTRLAGEGVRFDRVFSSSLRRAIESATVMLEAMGEPGRSFERIPALDEIRVATRNDQPFDQELDEHERREFEAAGLWWVYGPEAAERIESERLLQRRMMGWIEDNLVYHAATVKQPGRSRVALVSHGHAIRSALQAILGFDSSYVRRFQIDNSSISRMRFYSNGWFPVSVNDALHTHELGDVNREKARHPHSKEDPFA